MQPDVRRLCLSGEDIPLHTALLRTYSECGMRIRWAYAAGLAHLPPARYDAFPLPFSDQDKALRLKATGYKDGSDSR